MYQNLAPVTKSRCNNLFYVLFWPLPLTLDLDLPKIGMRSSMSTHVLKVMSIGPLAAAGEVVTDGHTESQTIIMDKLVQHLPNFFARYLAIVRLCVRTRFPSISRIGTLPHFVSRNFMKIKAFWIHHLQSLHSVEILPYIILIWDWLVESFLTVYKLTNLYHFYQSFD